MDRGYLDFKRLYKITLASAFFVTRAKSNFVFKRLYSLPVDKSTGVLSDQIITLSSFYPNKWYPDKLRRIRFHDVKNNKRLVFLTNNFSLSSPVIAELYRCRWQVELFFKWIKQHLRIKAFYGTTQNALKTQIWIAISVYVLVAIVKKTTKSGRQPLQNSTDSQRQRFRENAAFTGPFRCRLQRSGIRWLQPTDSMGVTLGQ